MENLSQLFAQQSSTLITWGGEALHNILEIENLPLRVQVEFISAKASPAQGIQLRLRGGSLVANGQEAADLVLWQDTAPQTVDVEIRSAGGRPGNFKVWNVWRAGLDVTQAWLGNSAMKVEGDLAGSGLMLRCSDGQGKPDFDDLVVRLSVGSEP